MEEIFISPMTALPLKKGHNNFIMVHTLQKNINF